MAILKEGLDSELYDEVRICLGLEPILTAAAKGKKITSSIRENIEEITRNR